MSEITIPYTLNHMQDLLQTFLKNTYSVSQIRHRFNVLKSHLDKQFFNTTSSTQVTSADLFWLQSLGKPFFDNFNPLNINQLLADLDTQLKNIQPLTIYVSFEMPEEEADKLGAWLRTNISPTVVFETKFDGTLIGGAAFSWKGIYHDYSIRSKIDKEKAAIIQSMKRLLK